MAWLRRYGPALLVLLAVLGFTAQVFSTSSKRPHPRWDEVQYLALAREYAKEGGALATIRCHFEGRCKEDNRHPLYQLPLQAVVDGEPQSFADAKLVTLGTALLLLGVVLFATRRRFGWGVAVATTALLSLMANLVLMSASLVHDVLFAALVFAAIHAIAHWQARGLQWWLVAGGLIGLAYLTKGIGHFLFVPLVAVGLHHHRLRFLRRPILYAALIGFAAAASFLLWRNVDVFGSPLHNVSIRAAWLDDWEQYWSLARSPEWSKVGLGWFLERHSLFDLALRLIKGFGITLGLFIYSAGLGTTEIVPCAITGLVVVVLAMMGLVRRYRAGHHSEVLAVAYLGAIFFAGYSFGAQAGLIAPRYTFPLVVLCLPYMLWELVERVGPFLRRRLSWSAPRLSAVALGTLAALLTLRLAFFAEALTTNPRTYYGTTEAWQRTSTWFAANLKPAERFALPNRSQYSTWDRPLPDTDPRWSYWYAVNPKLMLQQMDARRIRKVLVDTEEDAFSTYQDKLSPERDARGPLAFLGWPRCFADGAEPSRLLVYCQPE